MKKRIHKSGHKVGKKKRKTKSYQNLQPFFLILIKYELIVYLKCVVIKFETNIYFILSFGSEKFLNKSVSKAIFAVFFC